ncbi:hypothetical protein ACLKA7_007241 [Drosophila subpalustris]
MPERSISQRDVDEIEIESDEEDDELEQGVGLPVRRSGGGGGGSGAISPKDNARRHGQRGISNGPTARQERSRERERFGSANAAQEAKFYDDEERRDTDNDDDGSDDDDDIEMLD